MRNIFQEGDVIHHEFQVAKEDTAQFQRKEVHKVCSTYTLGREVEWASRKFVLEMIEENEEGIGTKLSIDHMSPAFVGDVVRITMSIKSLVKNEIICSYRAQVGDRLVAKGLTGQKIFHKKRIHEIFDKTNY